MEGLMDSIKKSLESQNWYVALVSCLIIPDVCRKLSGVNNIQKGYQDWFELYMKQYMVDGLSGHDCYALRCAYLHEGHDNMEVRSASEKQKEDDILDRIIFCSDFGHLTRLTNNYFGAPDYDGKDILCLSVKEFCSDMVAAAERWMIDKTAETIVQENIKKMLKINNEGIMLGGLLISRPI